MFKDVLGIFSWTLACFCILLRFPELLKRYVSRTVTCIWPSAKNSSLPSLNVKNKESELHIASVNMSRRQIEKCTKKMAQLHILKNLWFINCISSHESCQVFGDPCMSNWPHLQMQPDLCSNPRAFPHTETFHSGPCLLAFSQESSKLDDEKAECWNQDASLGCPRNF